MVDFFGIVGIGTTAFVATNIDDLLILIAFFANSRFPLPQIVLGQYAGMGALLAISIVGSLIVLIVPNNLIGLIGIFPIARRISQSSASTEQTEKKIDSIPAFSNSCRGNIFWR